MVRGCTAYDDAVHVRVIHQPYFDSGDETETGASALQSGAALYDQRYATILAAIAKHSSAGTKATPSDAPSRSKRYPNSKKQTAITNHETITNHDMRTPPYKDTLLGRLSSNIAQRYRTSKQSTQQQMPLDALLKIPPLPSFSPQHRL